MLKPHLSTIIEKGLPALLDDIRQSDKGSTSSSSSTSLDVGGNASSSINSSSSSSSSSSSERFTDLRRMFLLLERVTSLDRLKQGWMAFIK